MDVGGIFADLSLRTDKFKKGLEEAKTLAGTLGSDIEKKFNTHFDKMANHLKSVLGQVRSDLERAAPPNLGLLESQLKSINRELRESSSQISAHYSRVGEEARKASQKASSAARDTGRAQETAAASAISGAKTVGKEMEKAYGKRPQEALKETEKVAKRVTWTMRGYIKDTARVITGILISQAFYKLLRVIKEVGAAVWEMTSQLERAAISFKYLIGDERAGEKLNKLLRDFAAATSATLEESINSARMLLAAGFHLKDVLPVLNILIDTSTVAGVELERIVEVFSLIRSRGHLTAMEMRMLQTLGLDIVRILREELNLTEAQAASIGKLRIPAETAINAILKGFEKRFKGAHEDFAKTVKGYLTIMGDTLMVMASKVLEPFYNQVRDKLGKVLDVLENVSRGVEKVGSAFLLTLFRPEIQGMIKVIIGSFMSLWDSLKMVGKVVIDIGRILVEYLGTALSLVLPIVSAVVRVLARLLQIVTMNIPFIKTLVSVILSLFVAATVTVAIVKLGAALKWLIFTAFGATKAIALLGNALKALYVLATAHPVAALITLTAALLIVLAMSIDSVRAAVNNVMNSFMKMIGLDINNLLVPEVADDYADAWDNISDSIQQVEDDLEDAGKEFKKFLASFDEVYEVPEALDDIGSSWPAFAFDFEMPELPEIVIPEFEGLESTGINLGKIFDDLLDKLKIFLFEWKGNIPKLFPELVPLLDLLSQLAHAWEWITEKVRGFSDEVARVIREGVVTLFPQSLVDAWETAKTRVGEALDGVERILREGLTETIPQVLVEGVATIVVTVATLPALVALKLTEWVTDGAKYAEDWGEAILEEIELAVTSIAAAIALLPVSVALEMTKWVTDGAEAAKEWGEGVLEEVNAAVAEVALAVALLPVSVAVHLAKWVADGATYAKDWGKAVLEEIETAVVDIAAAIALLPVSVAVTLTEWVAEGADFAKEWGEAVLKGLEKYKTPILLVVAGVAAAIVLSFVGVPASVGGALAGLVAVVGGLFGKVGVAAAAETDETKERTIGTWEQVSSRLSELWEGIRKGASDKWSAIKEVIKENTNVAIDFINKLIRAWNSISFDVPKIDLGPIGSIGGGRISLPYVKEIPRLQHGGIIPKEMDVRAGERGKEAIVPLTGEDARPFAKIIASEIAAVMQPSRSDSPPVYVGALIADERGLRELERRMRVIRLRENERVGQL